MGKKAGRTGITRRETGRVDMGWGEQRRWMERGGNHRLVALSGFCSGFSPPLFLSLGLTSFSFGLSGVGSGALGLAVVVVVVARGPCRLMAASAASRDGPPSAARIPFGCGAGVGVREPEAVGVDEQEWEEGNRWVGQKVCGQACDAIHGKRRKSVTGSVSVSRCVHTVSCGVRERRDEGLTSHLTPNPPINPLLHPTFQQTSPLSFLPLNTSLSLPTSSLRASHFAEPICASIVWFASPPGGVPTGSAQIGQGMGVRSGGGDGQGWEWELMALVGKGEWCRVQKGRRHPGHWRGWGGRRERGG